MEIRPGPVNVTSTQTLNNHSSEKFPPSKNQFSRNSFLLEEAYDICHRQVVELAARSQEAHSKPTSNSPEIPTMTTSPRGSAGGADFPERGCRLGCIGKVRGRRFHGVPPHLVWRLLQSVSAWAESNTSGRLRTRPLCQAGDAMRVPPRGPARQGY
jgi:hypothetical protein